MTMAPYIEAGTELSDLLKEDPLVVVDCTASWCGPCKIVAPLMDQLAQDYADQVKVFKLDLDTHKTVAKQYGVRSIPAVMVFKDGELMESIVGVKPYSEFSAAVERYL